MSLSRRSRRSPLQAEVALLLPALPPRGDKSDGAKLSFRVGVSGSIQLKPADCRLAEAMSRLLAGGGGSDRRVLDDDNLGYVCQVE
jgi:hypothetical protein